MTSNSTDTSFQLEARSTNDLSTSLLALHASYQFHKLVDCASRRAYKLCISKITSHPSTMGAPRIVVASMVSDLINDFVSS